MDSKILKKLKKKLNYYFIKDNKILEGYDVEGGINDWLSQSGIPPSLEYRLALYEANNESTVYPFDISHRKRIITYLINN